jgi:hypothetical protein
VKYLKMRSEFISASFLSASLERAAGASGFAGAPRDDKQAFSADYMPKPRKPF